mmetsp:Transcript_3049/g.5852  ORF Transcript_3049/g.5852 Transcript_3049/m.5852 type:complete len:129 (-) Transcript_3049:3194-3580(-)
MPRWAVTGQTAVVENTANTGLAPGSRPSPNPSPIPNLGLSAIATAACPSPPPAPIRVPPVTAAADLRPCPLAGQIERSAATLIRRPTSTTACGIRRPALASIQTRQHHLSMRHILGSRPFQHPTGPSR